MWKQKDEAVETTWAQSVQQEVSGDCKQTRRRLRGGTKPEAGEYVPLP